MSPQAAGPGSWNRQNRGALEVGGKSIGLQHSLTHEQGAETSLHHAERVSFYHYFALRQDAFPDALDGVVVIPRRRRTLTRTVRDMDADPDGKAGAGVGVVGRGYGSRLVDLEAGRERHYRRARP